MPIVLYNQCRSGPSHRVRIGLAMKQVAYEYKAVDIRNGGQRTSEFLARNPQGLVPALDVDGFVLTQSGAILEWLEETCPGPGFFPAPALDRALVRGMAAVVGCDIQPLNNLRIQQYLRRDLRAEDDAVRQWQLRWLEEGFTALERLVEKHGGLYCFGDSPSLADIYLVPQAFTAARIGLGLDSYPRLASVNARAFDLPAFQAAHPLRQPDWN
jgi:maleylpyruvate isomerase